MSLTEFNQEEYDREKHDDWFEEGRIEGEKSGIAKGEILGIKKGILETAKNMLKDKLPFDVITKYTGLSLAEIQKL